MNPELGLATNYLDNNSTFYQVVQRIQSGMTGVVQYGPNPITDRWSYAGGELFWVGTPRLSLNTALIQPRATGTVVGVDGHYIYVKGQEFSDTYGYYGMSIQFDTDIGAITAGTTYYLRNWWTDNNEYGSVSVIQVSDTFTRENYNTKSTGTSVDTGVTDSFSATFKAGGYDPIDFTDVQPNYYIDDVDRGWDCLTFAVAEDSDLLVDCGPDPFCDFDTAFAAGIMFALNSLFGINSPYEILVLKANNEYGIFPEILLPGGGLNL